MKRLLLPLLILLTCCANAQVFQARDLLTGLSAGPQSLSFDLSDTAGYRDEYRGLRGMRYGIHAEFGISSFMGVGLNYSYTTLTGDALPAFALCRVSEFTPEVTYHVPWKNPVLDLSIAAGLGISAYYYQSYESNWGRAHISSASYFAEARPRFYFSAKNRLGAFLFYRFTYYNGYGEASDKTTPQYEYNAIGSSHATGLGLFYRCGKARTAPADSK